EQKNGSFIWCRISASCYYSEDGSPKHIFGTILNVNNEQEYLNRLRREAEYDITTGIFNKQTFFMETRRLLEQYVDDEFCIIRFDIDNFKLINELFGHDEGDKVLTHIASHLENMLMNYDRRSYGRLEADIFCICIKKEDTPDVLQKVTHITDDYPLDFDMLITTGVYEISDRNLSIDVMCDRAHLASKTIKGNYITRTAYFDEQLHESILNEQVITSLMNTAIEEKQFIVYYQPKFHISNNSICGAEALVRWIHPERGMIYPDKFIPVFERNGFIMKLDEYVWEQVCSDMRENLDLGKKVLPVSVNISKINLYNPRLCDTLIGLVEKYNIPVNLFQLELTESAFTDNKFVLINVMERLKNYGFTVMMDDFGSGYSSLNMLKEIPVDVLKIDLHFLSGDDESGKGGKILSSVITMAKWLNMHVITEGIETKRQLDFLRSIGCEDGQGYYFAKPMTRADYEKLVENGLDKKEECYLAAKEFDIEELWNPNSKLSVLFNTIMSAFGIFEMNSGKVQPIRLNDQFFEMIGCSRDSFTDPQADSVFNAYTAQDKNVVQALFRTALMTKNISESTF
ncbi:MAG: putative bifunctional diguanylate cyclase/phosphodiesterase, partial [Huintestinicola sp.]